MNSKTLSASILTAFFILAALSSCVKDQKDSHEYHIYLIAKSSESYFWLTCFQGAESAAVEYNGLNLTTVAPAEEWDHETQNDYILKAIEEKADAIVFSACDYEKSVAYVEAAMDAGIPVVTIDSGVNTSKDITFIGTDNYFAGQMAASAVVENVGVKAGVGIVSFEESSANGSQRVQGFLDYMADYPEIEILEIFYSPSDYDIARNATESMMASYGDNLHAIATFNELTTIGVGRAVIATGNPDSLCVVGFDNNIESVKMLEEGYLNSLVVQNSFAMGYLGVQQALEEIRGAAPKANIATGTVIVTKENMYNTEMEKLLFPFSN